MVLNLSLHQLNVLLLQLFRKQLGPEQFTLRLNTNHGQQCACHCEQRHV
jgi:hypothetical protein